MVLISAEPVIFLFMCCYSIMINLGQKFILDRLCLQRMGNLDCSSAVPPPLNYSFSSSAAGFSTLSINDYESVETMKDVEGYETKTRDAGIYNYNGRLSDTVSKDDVRSEAVQLYMTATAINAISSIISSQFLGYWMDRMSRKVLMTAPVGGGVAWAMSCVLVAYFESCPIQLIFIGVCLGGISGGYVTLKAAVTSYVVQETPPERRTIRLSVLEAAIFLGASAGLLFMTLATTYVTTNYVFLFLGVQGAFILILVYIFCFLSDDVKMDFPHLKYNYDELDGPALSPDPKQGSYGSLNRTSLQHLQRPLSSSDIQYTAGRHNESIHCEKNSVSIANLSQRARGGDAMERIPLPHGGDDILSSSGVMLTVPFVTARAPSVNSVYGTPPDIIVTDEVFPGEGRSSHPLSWPAGSITTISQYGTPPQITDVIESLDENERTQSDSYTESSRGNGVANEDITGSFSRALSGKGKEELCEAININVKQPRIVVQASFDDNDGLKYLAVPDKMTPWLTDSTVNIQSNVKIRNKRISTAGSFERRKELGLSKSASDSALDKVDGRELHASSKTKFEEGYHKSSRTRVSCVSTPDSLNYLALSDYGYIDPRESFDNQDNLYERDFEDQSIGHDEMDGHSMATCCTVAIRRMSDSIKTTFRTRPDGVRAMIIADVIANFLVSYVLVAETDNAFLYLNHKFDWEFTQFSIYYGMKSAVDGCSLLMLLPLLRRFLGVKDAALGVLGGLSRAAFFFMLALLQYSSQVYAVPFIGIFGQYLFVAERSIMSSLVEEDEQGRVFTVLSSVDQLALLLGALTFDNLFSVFVKRSMPGVVLLIAGFVVLIPTVIFGALFFSMNARQKMVEDDDEKYSRESDSLLPDNQSYLSTSSYSKHYD
ncbi:uncharacterized protein [Palaemon carinicauda]|uniref:uncharacterized protein n=1 Tax=Palaemon carinicauda TaxID=392227 RepID=UPI0035B5C684